MEHYPNLLSPITLGSVTFRNRIFSAPMSGADITADCTIGRGSTAFYELRAKGGAAAVTVSECVVHPATDRSFMYHPDDAVTGALASFATTADAISRHGAVASAELSHAGRYAGSYRLEVKPGETPVKYGPSDDFEDGVEIRALTEAQIADIVASYGKSAAFLKRAGYGMIMLHAGHGWLINQFLSPAFNRRTDRYGGSLENRTRFLLEIIDSVRAAVGPGFPIELRMSGAEYIDGGYDIDGGIEIAKAVDGKVDLIHVSAASHHNGFAITHPSMFEAHGRNVPLAAAIKPHVHTPVATLGGLNDPDQMEEILASGKADVIYLGRALLADPELPRKVAADQADSIRRCLRCFTCMAERVQTQTRRCAVNPLIGHELEGDEIQPAPKQRLVYVAGGGVAGMQAAVTAAQRGHVVHLFEQSDRLGGIVNSEQTTDFKREMYELGQTLAQRCVDEGVELHLNTPLTDELCRQARPDALIVAVGSTPIVPPLPGIERAIVVNDLYQHEDEVKGTVAILGGGLAGCECAVHLARSGKQVHLIEMRDALAPDANVRHRPILLAELKKQGVVVHTNTTGLAVTDAGVRCQTADGEITVPGETVICAAGQRANRAAADPLRTAAPFVRLVGDCNKVANITQATYQGYHAALDV
jgi:2,4-dienoyl-CoA reductase-like NADH-dependent reductase (Old Yellow Enzyme family)/thioredoxin reductase